MIVAITTMLAQCGGWHEVSAKADTSHIQPGDNHDEIDIVVVGDSIAAGPASSMWPVHITADGRIAGDFNDDPRQIRAGPWPDCPQVGTAWPFRLAEQSGKRVVDLACSGATISDIVDGTATRPSQLDENIIKRAKRVLVVAGANDVKFADGLMCMILRDCTEADLPEMFAKLASLQGDLTRLLNKIVEINPQAAVTLVGYPTLFAANSQLHPLLCPGIMPADVSLSLKAQGLMIQADEGAVATVKAAGGNVSFFNPQQAAPRLIPTASNGMMFAVSDACTDTPARIITSPTNTVDPIQQMIHPNMGGHIWYADLLQEELGLAG